VTRRATITSVALAAGVSVSNVSKVVNGQCGITIGTSTRVQELVQEPG